MRLWLSLRVLVMVSVVVGAPPHTRGEATMKLPDHKKLWLLKKKLAGSSGPQPPTSSITVKFPDLFVRLSSHQPPVTTPSPSALPSVSSHSSYNSSPPHPSPSGGCVVEVIGGSPGRLLKEGTMESLGSGVCGVRHCAKYGDKFVLEEDKCNQTLHNPNYTCLQLEDPELPFPLCCPRLECHD